MFEPVTGMNIREVDLSPSTKEVLQRQFVYKACRFVAFFLEGDFTVATRLLCGVPIHFHLYDVEVDESSTVDLAQLLKKRCASDVVRLASASTYLDEETSSYVIDLRFFKLPTETPTEFFNKMYGQYGSCGLLAFLYLHECLHILNRDLCRLDMYKRVCSSLWQKHMKNKPPLTPELAHTLCNMATDYHINSTLSRDNQLYTFNKQIHGLYHTKYDSSKMTQMDILADLIKTNKFDIKSYSVGDWVVDEIHISDSNDAQQLPRIFIRNKQEYEETQIHDSQKHREAVNNTVVKMRSAGSNSSVLQKMGFPLEVRTDWLDRLMAITETYCYEKTNNYDVSWAKPNKVVRSPFYRLPGTQYFKDKPYVILTYDSSASMGREELRKINHVLNTIHKKGFDVVVLVHTDRINDIREYSTKDTVELDKFIQSRKWTGGTSHSKVFEWIEERTKADRKKYMVLIASDMVSDIDTQYGKYRWPKEVKTIGISTSELSLPFGVTVHIN